MAYCPSCGSSVEGRFCAKCGTAVAAPGAPAQSAPPPAGPPPGTPPVYGSAPTQPPPGYSAAPPPPGSGAPPPPGYGQPQGGYVPPQPGYGPPQGGYVPPPPGAQYASAPGLQENVASALCYVLFAGIFFLLIEPYSRNRTIRFHAFQGLFLFGASVVISVVFSMLMWNMMYGFGLWGMMTMVYLCIRLALFVLWLFLVIKAYQGQKFVLPIIGPLAEKQANS